MAAGDADDFAARLRTVLPDGWFADEDTALDAILQGLGAVWAVLYGQLAFTRAQARIATSTGAFLDLASGDFLPAFRRRLNEPDAAFSLRIRREIVRPRNTRAAIIRVLQDLTGNTPIVFRPSYVADTGSYGAGGMAYGMAGAWGSYTAPFQALVQVERGTAPGSGVAVSYPGALGGYGTPPGGYGIGSMQYGSGAAAQGAVTDTDIFAAVASVTPAGHINWVAITDYDPTPQLAVWDTGAWDTGAWAP